MRAHTTVANLLSALSHAKDAMVASPPMLAYTGVLLDVDGTTMTVHSCDGDTSAAFQVDASDTVAGRALLPPAPLLAWLRTLPGTTGITLTCDSGTHMDVSFGTSNPYRFRTLSATFPVPGWASGELAGGRIERFSEALAAVAASSAGVADVTDKVVHLVSSDAGLTLYSTDTFRITRARLPSGGFGDHSLVLPLRTLSLAAKLGVAGFSVESGGSVVVDVAGGRMGVRPLAAAFPPAEQVMSAPAAYRTVLDTSEVLGVLSRMRALAGATYPVVVDIDGQVLRLSVDAEDTGSGTEEVALPSPAASAVRFGLNVDYFRQSLEALPGPQATVEWTSPNAPVRLSAAGDLDVSAVVMPVKLAQG